MTNLAMPGPIFKLPVMLLNNALKFSYCLCPCIVLHKLLLPESEDKPTSQALCILKQLSSMNFNVTFQAA